MKVALYARVSTADKDQDPETQLLQLRDYCRAQGWDVHREYVDKASAGDLRRRKQWRELLEDGSRRRFDAVFVWRLDRAFRSVPHAADTLEKLRHWKLGFRSCTESWIDTTAPFGEALFYITAAYASLERSIITERVRAGMDRARRQGKSLGRPKLAHKINLGMVQTLKSEGKTWKEIARAHPSIKLANGRQRKPSASTLRKVFGLSEKVPEINGVAEPAVAGDSIIKLG